MRSWTVLMDNFALQPEVLNAERRVKLLVRPLTHNNSRQESTIRYTCKSNRVWIPVQKRWWSPLNDILLIAIPNFVIFSASFIFHISSFLFLQIPYISSLRGLSSNLAYGRIEKCSKCKYINLENDHIVAWVQNLQTKINNKNH